MESKLSLLFSKTKLLQSLCQQTKLLKIRHSPCSQNIHFPRPLYNGSHAEKVLRCRNNVKVTLQTSSSWNIKVCYSTESDSIEKKLIKFMDMWEMEKAVLLMRESVIAGTIPHQNIVLNLLQQLANLGETECLLDLHDFLQERNLVTDTKFFMCLQEAYYNSGRVDEGVAVLRILYHRTRKYRDVEPLFCLLAVMVIRNFPDRIDLIDGFVTDLKEFAKPVIEPMASLWKCYMLTEQFEKADELLLQNEEIQPFVPQMVNDICAKVNKIEASYDKVLSQLMDVPFIKQKQKVLIYETHAETLCDEGQHEPAVKSLLQARSLGLSLHPARVRQIVTKMQQLTSHSDQETDINVVLQWCDQLEHR